MIDVVLKVGQIHPETGLIYLGKQKGCKDGMRWCTVEKYAVRKSQISAWAKSETAKISIRFKRNTDSERAKRNAYAKVWNKSEAQKKRAADYARKKRAMDYMHCLRERVRARISEAIRDGGYGGRSKTTELLGCGWDCLKAHIESLFFEGMSWDNRSEWHVDHIIPLASATTEEELLPLFHYTNLQPLWARENQRKGASLDAAIYCKRAMMEMDK